MTQLDDLLAIASNLAQQAGKIVRDADVAGRAQQVTKSSATDPVTETDKATEAFILSAIETQRPDDGVIGEEGASKPSTSGVTWVLDPIDGTTNFIYGVPNFCISIGATVDGVPAVGAVYNPTTNELFTAATGRGAYLNGKQISVNSNRELSLALVATGFAYSAEKRKVQGALFAELIGNIRDLRRMGSAALDLCNLACGRVDAYYEDTVNAWDVTAGIVIAREAGALVTSFDGNPAFERNIVGACTPEVHAALLPFAARS